MCWRLKGGVDGDVGVQQTCVASLSMMAVQRGCVYKIRLLRSSRECLIKSEGRGRKKRLKIYRIMKELLQVFEFNYWLGGAMIRD